RGCLERPNLETNSMDNIKKEKKFSWSEMCNKADPYLNAPKPMYVFDNGNRVFYSQPKKAKGTK
ncbi:MAG: hypothetical protein ACPHEU_09115, partial [Acidimicrobiales bacterium]